MKPIDSKKALQLIEQSTSFVLLVRDKDKVRSLCGGDYREEIIRELWHTSPVPEKKDQL